MAAGGVMGWCKEAEHDLAARVDLHEVTWVMTSHLSHPLCRACVVCTRSCSALHTKARLARPPRTSGGWVVLRSSAGVITVATRALAGGIGRVPQQLRAHHHAQLPPVHIARTCHTNRQPFKHVHSNAFHDSCCVLRHLRKIVMALSCLTTKFRRGLCDFELQPSGPCAQNTAQ